MGVVGVAVGVVISDTFIGVFVGELVTVVDGSVGRGRVMVSSKIPGEQMAEDSCPERS